MLNITMYKTTFLPSNDSPQSLTFQLTFEGTSNTLHDKIGKAT